MDAMKRQRKSFTTEFKVKIALDAIKGQRTVNEISIQYGVHPNQVTQWKRQVIESLPEVFSTKSNRVAEDDEALSADRAIESRARLDEKSWIARLIKNVN